MLPPEARCAATRPGFVEQERRSAALPSERKDESAYQDITIPEEESRCNALLGEPTQETS
jgi:hypothetical protein